MFSHTTYSLGNNGLPEKYNIFLKNDVVVTIDIKDKELYKITKDIEKQLSKTIKLEITEKINDRGWWTMTSYAYKYSSSLDANVPYAFFNRTDGDNIFSLRGTSIDSDPEPGVRPVINLKANNIINSGNGTIDNPYKILET